MVLRETERVGSLLSYILIVVYRCPRLRSQSVLTLLEKKGELKTMVVFCSDGAQHTVAWNPNARTPSTGMRWLVMFSCDT